MAARGGEAKEQTASQRGWGADVAEIVSDITEPLVAAHGEASWAVRRALYGLDSAVSSPKWQTLFLLVLAFAICLSAGRVMEATENSMHSNEAHDTSYSVRAPAARTSCTGKAGVRAAPAEPHEWRGSGLERLTSNSTAQEGIWLAWILFVDPASIPYAEGERLGEKAPRTCPFSSSDPVR